MVIVQKGEKQEKGKRK